MFFSLLIYEILTFILFIMKRKVYIEWNLVIIWSSVRSTQV